MILAVAVLTGALAVFCWGAAIGAHTAHLDAQEATQALREQLADANDRYLAQVRLNLDAHRWPARAMRELQADLERWDAGAPYDWEGDI